METTSLRVTMETVAREAKVSRATVSRVLSGSAAADEETRKRVLAACKSLGYVRNEIATQLARRSSDVVGFLVRDTINPAYAHLHDELLRSAFYRGMFVATMSAGTLTLDHGEVKRVHRLMSLRPAGLFIATGIISSSEIIPFASQVPTVILPRPEVDPRLNTVGYDEVANATMIAEAVIASGHRSAAVVCPPKELSLTENLRAKVAIGCLDDAGVRVTRLRGIKLTSNLGATFGRIVQGIQAKRYSVVVFPNDTRAIDFLIRARSAGVKVPDDIGVTGLDGVGMATELAQLTTVRVPVERVCGKAAELMKSLIEEPGKDPKHYLYPGYLIQGSTVA